MALADVQKILASSFFTIWSTIMKMVQILI